MIGPRLKSCFARLPLFGLAGALCLSGCSGEISEFMREPRLTPVGAGLVNPEVYGLGGALPLPSGYGDPSFLPPPNIGNLYTDARVTRVGDIVTVLIAINDKATFGNSMDRTRTSKNSFLADWNFVNNMLSPSGSSASSSPQPSSVSGDINSSSSTVGQGNIDRQEQIQVSVAAVVTDVLPNGNLVISGSQEVRVNYELRQLAVGGIIRPSDISPNNTVSYDRIAEARIAYGGRGRLNDFQQPSWGQQILDAFRPF
jgi:flagellar L-ring protein FlgH